MSKEKKNYFFLFFIALVYFLILFQQVRKNLQEPNTPPNNFLKNDSVSYMSLSGVMHKAVFGEIESNNIDDEQDLKKYDIDLDYFSYDNQLKNPHRLPLYPIFLFISRALFGDNLISFGIVNCVIATLLLILVFYGIQYIFGNYIVSFACVFAYCSNQFIYKNVTTDFLTEPLFVLLLFLVIINLIKFIRTDENKYLYLLSIISGLTLMLRPNGVILYFSALFSIITYEVYIKKKIKEYKKYAFSFLLFLIASFPVVAPKVYHFGNPFYFGYLSNFMWADTYEEANVFGSTKYTALNYIKTHSLKDMGKRFLSGQKKVFFNSFKNQNDFLYPIYALGIVICILIKMIDLKIMTLFMYIQLLPMSWSAQANPTLRIPTAILYPFCFVYFSLFILFFIKSLKQFKINNQ